MKFPKGTIACAMALCAQIALAADVDRTGGPYVPTPQSVVDAMLEVASVGPEDYVVDLGSGDGRIVLTAATKRKASGMGVDIDPELVDLANASARKLGVADRVQFVRQDVFAADLSRTTVLTLYLLPGMMQSLRPKLLADLKPGTRIVSHDFTFDLWKPDRTVTVQTDEKYEITGTWTSEVHLWIVPAAVQGAWRITRAGGKAGGRLDIRQGFQHFDGKFSNGERTVELKDGRLEGARLSFSVPAANGRRETFTGTVERGQISGEVREGEMVIARWSATRVP
jgi:SAM-dependent methyltransferase